MATILPEGKQRFTDGNGNPLAGGKLYTYAAGTSTPKATYADADATVMLVRAGAPIAMHRHLRSEEIAHLVSGAGVLQLADGARSMRAGDLAIVPRNTPHAFTPTGDEPAVLLSTFVPTFQEGDRVPEPAK